MKIGKTRSLNTIISDIKLSLLLFLGFSSLTLNAQNQQKIDSLLADLSKTSADTTKINDYNKLFLEFRHSDTVKAKQYIALAISLSDKINYKKGLGTALFNNGVYLTDKDDLKKGIQFYEKSLQLRREINDKKGIALCLNGLGNAYYFLGNYPESLKNYQESLIIREQIGPPVTVAYACSNIGEVYRQQNNQNKAIEYIKRALEILNNVGDVRGLANNFNNLGLIYKECNKFNEALEYFHKSIELYQQINDIRNMASTFNNIGIVFAEKGQPQLAIESYKKTLVIADSLKDRNQSATTILNMAEAYHRLKEYPKALAYAKQGLRMSQEIETLPLEKSAYEILSVINNSLGNTKDAFQYYVKYSELKDSLFDIEKHKQVAEMESKYQSEKKETEIQLKNFEIEKKSVQLKQQKTQKYALSGGIFLMIILAIVVFISYKRIKKTNTLLGQHQVEIEYKNNELSQQNSEILAQRDEIQSQHARITQIVFNITESIRYAEKIQLALLPSDSILKCSFADFFVLYKPKDIVSGDFYWLSRQNKYIHFVVADCTGHGVPGAFMSMLGISYLNEIIARSEVIHAGEVLNKLRNFFINAWQQNELTQHETPENTMMEGMDIAFCTLNTETLELRYAGANNPCWIVRRMNLFIKEQPESLTDGQLELIELNGDKMPVGHYERMDDFVTQSMQLQKDDQLYLMSDGFKSQLGGTKGTKFLVKNLKSLILEISAKSMIDQKSFLEISLDNWRKQKGSAVEQTDDITILGIRI